MKAGFLSLLLAAVLLTACKKNDSNRSTDPEPYEAIVVSNFDEHDVVYRRGTERISPHMILMGQDPEVTEQVREDVARGITDLKAVTAFNPENWAAFWITGKGYQILGNFEQALIQFRASFDLQKENADVAREYASACLELGDGAEAARATQHAIALTPEDAGLHANLALALLIDGKTSEAQATIQRSLQMAPNDKISQAVEKLIGEVIAGERSQPNNMADLQK